MTIEQQTPRSTEEVEEYRKLFDLAPDVIYGLAADGTFTFLSPAFETITGYKVEDWLGKSFAMLVHPEDLPLAQARFLQGLRGETPAPYEIRCQTRDGDWVIGEFRSIPRIENGAVVGKIGIARDITARVRVEGERAQLLELEQEARGLAESAAARTARLQAVTAELLSASTPVEVAEVVVRHSRGTGRRCRLRRGA